MPPAAGIPVLQGGEDVNGMRSVSSLFLCGRCVRKAGGDSGPGRAKVRLFLKTGGEDCGPGGGVPGTASLECWTGFPGAAIERRLLCSVVVADM